MHAICEKEHEGQLRDVSNKLRGQFLALYFYRKWLGLYAMHTLPSATIFSMETLGIFGSAFESCLLKITAFSKIVSLFPRHRSC